jgi:hypothetical protein
VSVGYGEFTYIGAGTGFSEKNFLGGLRRLRALEIFNMAF